MFIQYKKVLWTTLISIYSDTFPEKIEKIKPFREKVLRKPEDTLGLGHGEKQKFHIRETLSLDGIPGSYVWFV